jgi:CheY-like chemotaxis protein
MRVMKHGKRGYGVSLIAGWYADAHTGGMCRVLVVDDHPIVRKALVFYLRTRLKVDCVEATNGYEALKKVSESKPDLVILDYSMPVMNGIETARVMHNTMPELPILMLTAHFTAAEAASKDLGIRGVFSKDNVEPLLMQTRTVLKL